MKFSLTKELETVLKTVISLNKRDFPISVKDGYMLAQTDRGNIKVALGENNSLLGDEEKVRGFTNNMLKYISSFPAGSNITVEPDDKNVIIKCGRCRSKFATPDPITVNLPELGEDKIEVEADEFISALSAASTMCDTATGAKGLCRTIHISATRDTMTLLSTEGIKLLRQEIPCDSNAEKLTVMLDAGAIQVVKSMFKGSDSISLYPSERAVAICNENKRFDVLQIDCSYPDEALFRALVPEEKSDKFKVDPNAIVESIERYLSMKSATSLSEFSLCIRENTLVISGRDSSASYEDEFDIVHESEIEKEKTYYFSPEKLIAVLKSFSDEDEVMFCFGTYNRGLIVCSLDSKSAGCVIPMLKRNN